MARPAGMVILGAGHAGGRAANGLREAGWKGPIALIGAEPHPPYERPPLSKGLLTGDKTLADCSLYSADTYAQRDIRIITGTPALAVRREAHEVVLGSGDLVPYDKLLFATGAEPHRLRVPGNGLDGIHVLRAAADALLLQASLVPGRRIAVVGGGFIGLEVAASAVARGCEVVVVEAGPRLMMRTVPSPIEERMRLRHDAAGVDLRLGRKVVGFTGGEGRVSGLVLDDGSEVACDVALVSIGVAPRVDLARAAGLAIDNGIAVDRTLRTEDENIFAAGDAASFQHDLFGGRVRLESWKNAEEQGPLAARNMLGAGEANSTAPWMWSDQYELTIQIAGLPDRGDRVVERRLDGDSLVLFHLAEDGRIVGTSAIGPNGAIGRVVRLGQMMIERRLYPDERRLADPSLDLKTLMRAQAA